MNHSRLLTVRMFAMQSPQVRSLMGGNDFCSNKSVSKIRANFHKDCEDGIGRQITDELNAAYAYFSIANVFGRDTVALPGFHKLFSKYAAEEIDHAKGWVDYVNLRGGQVKFQEIKPIPENDWTPLTATDKAIEMELNMTQALEKLRELAEKHRDGHFMKFIEDEYLDEQYRGLKALGDLKTQIEMVGEEDGLYVLDYNIYKEYKCKS